MKLKIFSSLDIAFHKRISYIVRTENRPFSYMDFVPRFNVDGEVFRIVRGTFKNMVSVMQKSEELEVVCHSPPHIILELQKPLFFLINS